MIQKGPFDRAVAYRFSLAFQCIVSVGVRDSEPFRARVVRAGTLDVVVCPRSLACGQGVRRGS
jgi:hypothetical protein